MKTASPAVKSAMKSNLDDRIINTIESADPATKQAYKDVVDIAGEQSTKIGTKKQPTITNKKQTKTNKHANMQTCTHVQHRIRDIAHNRRRRAVPPTNCRAARVRKWP